MVKLSKKKLIEDLLKLLFACVFLVLITLQLNGHKDQLKEISVGFLKDHLCILAIVFLLMLIGLIIEATKWRISLGMEWPVSFKTSFLSTIGGNSLSAFTPNRIGEFAGRIMFLPASYRGRAAVLTIVGSYSQALCTIIAGIWALAIYAIYRIEMPTLLDASSLIIASVCTIILLTSFFNISLMVPLTAHIKFLTRFQHYIDVLSVLPLKTLIKIMALSILKYLVFCSQFILLLQMQGHLFDTKTLFYCIPLIFFIQTAIPSFAVVEIGMRSSVTVFILNATGNMLLPSIIGVTLLWLINLIIPSIIGGFFVLRHKFIHS